MPLIEGMPNVPVLKDLNNMDTKTVMTLGGLALLKVVFGNYWGIFNEYGVPILLADSVISLNFSNSYSISQAPLEQGSFASYNKVAEPYKATVQLSKASGGTLMRGVFLKQIDMLAASTLKFHIITPEYVYTNACIAGYDLVREAQDGAQLIKVNLHLEEVREVMVMYKSDEMKNPDDTQSKDGGEKQPLGASEMVMKKMEEVVSSVKGWFK